VARTEKKRTAHRSLVKTQSPIGRRTRRWEDNIKVNVQEVGKGGMDWIDLALDRDKWRAVVTTATNIRDP
jgi:hypothetical protein